MTTTIKINANDGVTRNVMVGGETTVDFDFPIYADTHIELYETDTTGAITQLVKDTDFTVPAGSVNQQAGGTLNLDSGQYPSGAAAATVFTAYQAAPYARTTDFNQAGDFFADTLNQELDLITQQNQQIRRDLNRAALAPVDTTLTTMTLPDPSDGKALIWDGVAGSIINGPDASEITSAQGYATAAAASAVDAAADAVSTAADVVTTTALVASVSLPTLGAADTVLQVNAGGTALEYGKVAAGNMTSGAATNGQIATADGSGGVAFEDGVVQTLLNSGYRTNYFYGPFAAVSSGNGVVTADQLYTHPFMVAVTTTFTRIGINVTTGAAGNARLGIYNFENGVATTLVLDAGTVSTATTGDKEVIISQELPPGIYCVAVIFDATPTVGESAVDYLTQSYLIGGGASTSGITGHYETRSYGALPATFSETDGLSNAVSLFIWMRVV